MCKRFVWGTVVLGFVLLASCKQEPVPPTAVPVATLPDNSSEAVTNTPTETAVPTITPTATAVPPTPTPTPPLAATVNGQPIFLAAYEKELARYEQAFSELGTEPDENYRQIVLDALIEKELILQAAAAAGISVAPELVDEAMADLQTVGDFAAWLQANLYTEEAFRQEVAAGIVTEQMMARVTAAVPVTAEQVHARLIHVNERPLADELLTRARAGDEFAFLADQFSLGLGNGGDIGWFMRGSLLLPELEEPIFALQNPDDISEVIVAHNSDGTETYYLAQLVERDGARPLTAQMRQPFLQAAFAAWLDGLWANADIVRQIDTGSGS
ncbi:MAG: hypothetical protein GY796_34060 [Chloroflexi bacterium]|nr:hypothetical protein [Chloroflexota bacterium]